MTTLYPPSNEQLQVINNVSNNNIVVDAIAGAGKTTTILHIAKTHATKKILLITYNSKLRHETKTRVQEHNILNVDVHTYHSYCYQFDKKCSTDYGIFNLLKTNTYNLNKLYDIIIIDEAQDITPLYYSVIHSIFTKYSINQKLEMNVCILGDKRQSIYGYNKADSRFITMYDQLYNINNKPWKKCNLTTTYRLSKNMVNFINNAILKTQSLGYSKTNISNESVDYLLVKIYDSKFIYEQIINQCIKKYGIENVLIIAPSVRELTPFKILINHISIHTSYPTYIPNSDNTIVDKSILNGKLVFLTFHQAKGLERECVIVYGIDNSYNKYYNHDCKNYNQCPNTIYVALTRAKQKLIILHDYKHPFLEFINIEELKKHTNIKFLFSKYQNKKYLIYDYKDNMIDNFIFVNNYQDHVKEKKINLLNIPDDLSNVLDDLSNISDDLKNAIINLLNVPDSLSFFISDDLKNEIKRLLNVPDGLANLPDDLVNAIKGLINVIKNLKNTEKYFKDVIKDRIIELNNNCPKKENIDTIEKKQYSVSEFIRHLSSDIINTIVNNYITKKQINPEENKINIISSVKIWYYKKILFEDITNINGIFIPFYYEYYILKRYNNTSIIKHLNYLYCIKKYELRYDIIEYFLKSKHIKLLNSGIIKNKEYIKYIYVHIDDDRLPEDFNNESVSIFLISYKYNEPKQFIEFKNNKIELMCRKNGNKHFIKTLKTLKKHNNKKSHYEIFFSYFDYLYYEGTNNFNETKLNFLDLRDKINIGKKLITSELLKISTIYDSFQNKIFNKLVQLGNCKYQWFGANNLQICINRLNYELNIDNIDDINNIRFEISVDKELEFCKNILINKNVNINNNNNNDNININNNNIDNINKININGAMDCIDSFNNTIYEFKFVNELLVEHYIQLSLYMFLHKNKDSKYYLYNIKTNEKIQLVYDYNKLTKIVELIYNNKRNINIDKNDDEFKNECDSIVKKLYFKKNNI